MPSRAAQGATPERPEPGRAQGYDPDGSRHTPSPRLLGYQVRGSPAADEKSSAYLGRVHRRPGDNLHTWDEATLGSLRGKARVNAPSDPRTPRNRQRHATGHSVLIPEEAKGGMVWNPAVCCR